MQTALSSKGQPKVVNRWLVIFGTALVQLGVGTFYAWSIFNTPILKMFHQLVVDPARSEEHRLNSSHVSISYAVFCLKKKNDSHDAEFTEHIQMHFNEIWTSKRVK